MGCSPSHAVIINSSPTHETICLQPRIYMVSESTLCLLRDVGELRVYHVDETDPESAVEKFRGAQEQLQNPLLFHPQLRRRERMNTDDIQSLPGPSNDGKEIESEDITENIGDRIEIVENEEQGDNVDYQNRYSGSGIISENVAKPMPQNDTQSSNAQSITVEVYSYKTNVDKSSEDDKRTAEKCIEVENPPEPLNDMRNNENTAQAAVDFAASSEQIQTSDEQKGSELEDCVDNVLPDATFDWEETANMEISAGKEDLDIAKDQRKKATNEEIVESDSL